MKYFHGYQKKHSFFEGWYLKHQSPDGVLALIPHTILTGRESHPPPSRLSPIPSRGLSPALPTSSGRPQVYFM